MTACAAAPRAVSGDASAELAAVEPRSDAAADLGAPGDVAGEPRDVPGDLARATDSADIGVPEEVGVSSDAGVPTGPEATYDQVVLPYDRAGTPHATQLLRPPSFGGDLLIANSYGGLFRYGVGEGYPRRFFTDATMPSKPFVYCYRAAVHAPSATLFCAGLFVDGIARFGADDGAFRGLTEARGEGRLLGLAQRGDTLFTASPEAGLWRRAIARDGTLGPSARVASGAYLHVVDTALGLAAVSRERGVELIEDDGTTRAVALPGPALGVRARGDTLWVALGSEGLARVDLRAMRVQRIAVSCAVSAVDATSDALVVGCRQGLRIYDPPAADATAPGPLRAATRASYSVSDVLIDGDTVFELDWRYLRRRSLREERAALPMPDAPLGVPVNRAIRTRFPVDNPFEVATNFAGARLAPLGRSWHLVPPNASVIRIRAGLPIGQEISVAPLESDRLAPGNAAPLGIRDAWVYFFQLDCALQWADIEDIQWLSTRGGFGDPRPIRVLSWTDTADPGLAIVRRAWPGVEITPLATIWAVQAPQTSFSQFTQRLDLTRDLGGPDATAVVDLSADGRVRGVANQYRGRYLQLAEPAP